MLNYRISIMRQIEALRDLQVALDVIFFNLGVDDSHIMDNRKNLQKDLAKDLLVIKEQLGNDETVFSEYIQCLIVKLTTLHLEPEVERHNMRSAFTTAMVQVKMEFKPLKMAMNRINNDNDDDGA